MGMARYLLVYHRIDPVVDGQGVVGAPFDVRRADHPLNKPISAVGDQGFRVAEMYAPSYSAARWLTASATAGGEGQRILHSLSPSMSLTAAQGAGRPLIRPVHGLGAHLVVHLMGVVVV